MPSRPVYRFRDDPCGSALSLVRSLSGNIARLKIRTGVLAACLCIVGIFAGCGSLERSNLFATGQDARTFNSQTGRYEWPDDEPAQRTSRPRARSAHERKEAPPDDGRVFNPQTGRFERADE